MNLTLLKVLKCTQIIPPWALDSLKRTIGNFTFLNSFNHKKKKHLPKTTTENKSEAPQKLPGFYINKDKVTLLLKLSSLSLTLNSYQCVQVTIYRKWLICTSVIWKPQICLFIYQEKRVRERERGVTVTYLVTWQ